MLTPRKRTALGLAIAIGLSGLFLSLLLGFQVTGAIADDALPASSADPYLQPAPTQPVGYYDYFGKLLSPTEARSLVASIGLDPDDPTAYPRIGAVEITEMLLKQGREIFFDRWRLQNPVAARFVYHCALSARRRRGRGQKGADGAIQWFL